ncbi:cytochrome [Flavobacterium cheongpyeongense]|uniref:Cytochrome n=1 Tax=Flavobacterium cheongpyeongense TaxID=2212651 RepID=A0A2V4C7F2_9FLAO|nr:cytochrome c [Flavobacterium cheongpyeongense]PXY42134.1 cytochrome [Flavobacterium cheongpyeongense]
MDFPMFHLDWLNNRMLIAIIAILHVIINHGLAVGFMPFVTWLEQRGVSRSGKDQITDMEWDAMVYKIMKVAFIITTTIGAMTGVGIWFSVALVSPASIGSLIRVFYWAWFTEWLVFVTEVVLIMIYFLTWKNSNTTLKAKLRHIKFGWYLSLFSWITMAIIVSILGFMMDPGNWETHKTLLNGFTNPIYLPQLFFRTPTAMLVAGIFGMFFITLFTKPGTSIRINAVKYASQWLLLWAPLSLIAAYMYYRAMPAAMVENMSTAVGSLSFSQYYNLLLYVAFAGAGLTLIIGVLGIYKTKWLRPGVVIIPVITAMAYLGFFERVREFIRKPYIISQYMYSNLLLKEDYAVYKQDGILKHATYTTVNKVTDENKIEAGKNVFIIACSRCHTAQGVNSIVSVFDRMYGAGGKPLDIASMAAYMPNMHNGRTFMPEFPGNEKEAEALASYIRYLQMTGDVLEGAQEEGVTINPNNSATTLINKNK